MLPALTIGNASVWLGECRAVMKALPTESVQCVVTSPPYFNLRDYGAEGQIGLEATPEEYVATMVDVFREVRRILRKDGVLWLNLGDSYAGSWGNQGRKETRGTQRPINGPTQSFDAWEGLDERTHTGSWVNDHPTLKPKDLIGIPWRVAFALQADGWYLRSEVIWSKPNGMPSSVTDRPTRNHEQVFLLTRSERYYYDKEAIAEPVVKGAAGSKFHTGFSGVHAQGRSSEKERTESETKNARSVWTISTASYKGAHYAVMPEELARRCILAGSRPADVVFDPFAGAGTTLKVAIVHGREAWGSELSPANIDLIAERLDGVRLRLI